MKYKSENDNNCLSVLALLLALPFGIVWQGVVTAALWGWFVVPLFGLPPLGIAYAVGLRALIGSFTISQPSDSEGATAVIVKSFLYPAAILVIGWIASLFI
jgi:hypothetical protein